MQNDSGQPKESVKHTRNKVELLENDIIYVTKSSIQTEETWKELARSISALTKQLRAQNKPVLILSDTSNEQAWSREDRKSALALGHKLDFDRSASFGTEIKNLAFRSESAKSHDKLSGRLRDFQTKEEAERWLLSWPIDERAGKTDSTMDGLPKVIAQTVAAAVRANPDAIVSLINDEGRFLYIAPSSKQILGYEPNEVVGHHYTEFYDPIDAAHVVLAYQDTLLNGQSMMVTRIVRMKSGSHKRMRGAGEKLIDPETGTAYVLSISRVAE